MHSLSDPCSSPCSKSGEETEEELPVAVAGEAQVEAVRAALVHTYIGIPAFDALRHPSLRFIP